MEYRVARTVNLQLTIGTKLLSGHFGRVKQRKRGEPAPSCPLKQDST